MWMLMTAFMLGFAFNGSAFAEGPDAADTAVAGANADVIIEETVINQSDNQDMSQDMNQEVEMTSQPPQAAPELTGESWSQRAPLQRFVQADQGRFLFLRQARSTHSFFIPVPYRLDPTKMMVHLEFNNSNALLANRSQIMLRMNGGVFAQAHLDPIFPDGSMDVAVPLTLLNSSDNELLIEVAQHYLMECEDPGSPELWTSVDLEKSYVDLSGALKTVQSSFAEVDHILGESGWIPQTLTILFASDDAAHIHAGTVLSQGLALRNKSQPTWIKAKRWTDGVSLEEQASGDIIVIGTRDEWADKLNLAAAKDGAIGQMLIQPREGDASHFVLGVVAEESSKLFDLSKAFAWSSLPANEQSVIQVFDIKMPEPTQYTSHVAVMEGHEYHLSHLGFKSTTLRGLVDQTHVDVWIPADLFATSHMNVELKLHVSYGAALRADSVLNIFHNGKFIRGVSLADERGLTVEDYLIKIPLASLSPGKNRFEFQSRMFAYTGSNCTTGNTENLLFTLFDDSTISIPNTNRFVEMPEINLLTRTGFPYADQLDSKPVIQVSAFSDAMLGAAWTFAARMAQVREAVVEPLTVVVDASDRPNIIRLSTVREVSEDFWAKAPVHLGESGFINHPTLANPNIMGRKSDSWRHQMSQLLDASVSDAPEYLKRSSVVRISEDVTLFNSAAMMQLENPEHAKGTLTLIVSDSEESLEQGVHRLVEIWDQLGYVSGDLVVWGEATKEGAPDFWSAHIDQHHYHVGTMPRWDLLSYYAIKYTGFLIALLFGMFVVMALITRWVLIYYRRNEHPTIEP